MHSQMHHQRSDCIVACAVHTQLLQCARRQTQSRRNADTRPTFEGRQRARACLSARLNVLKSRTHLDILPCTPLRLDILSAVMICALVLRCGRLRTSDGGGSSTAFCAIVNSTAFCDIVSVVIRRRIRRLGLGRVQRGARMGRRAGQPGCVVLWSSQFRQLGLGV